MIFNKTLEYALQTVIFLSNNPISSPISSPISQKKIAGSLNIPYHYLGKIFQQLNNTGITGSKTGPLGGFYLVKSPKQITLSDILDVFVGEKYFESCVLGQNTCDKSPCPIHYDGIPARVILRNIFNNYTVYDWSNKFHSST